MENNTNGFTSPQGTGGFIPPAQGQPASNGLGVLANTAPKRKSGWTIAIIVTVIVAVIALFVLIGKNLSDRPANDVSLPNEDYIAQLYVVGEIGPYDNEFEASSSSYSHAFSIDKLGELSQDKNCKGIMIYMDTPGGTVYESEELYQALMGFKKAQKGRKIFVYMSHYAASGGYYISSAADMIFANKNSWTGSIGVIIGPIFDIKDLLNEHGVYTNEITSGKNKAMGSNYEHLSDEQRAIMQSLVDEAYNDFVGVVAEGRGMSVEEIKKIADGRIYSARQAEELDLIDGIGKFENVLEALKKELDNMDIEVVVVEREAKDTFLSWLQGETLTARLQEFFGAKSELQVALEKLGENNSLVPMYLYKG